MPTSDLFNLTTVAAVINNLGPTSVLDVGCGFGKYGVVARELLDVARERLAPADWKTRLVGIEGCRGYRNPVHDFIYSEVHYGDAGELLSRLGAFDLVLILDVIEHLEKPAARDLIRAALAASPVVVVSTPIAFYEQAAAFGGVVNPLEMHRCHWTAEDFDPGVWVHRTRLVACDVFLAARRPPPRSALTLADPADVLYLRSRRKLGPLGLPLSLALRWACRLLS